MLTLSLFLGVFWRRKRESDNYLRCKCYDRGSHSCGDPQYDRRRHSCDRDAVFDASWGNDLASIFGVSHSKGGLVLYPNPVSGLLHIGGLQGRALVGISTLGGKIVRRAPVSASANSIDVSDLRGGTYVVAIESSEAALSKSACDHQIVQRKLP